METEAGPARHFGPRLRPGESILWAGRPDPNRWVTTFDAVLIPFSLVWGGMAVGVFGVFQGWWGTSKLRDWILRLRTVPQEERSGMTFPPRR